MNVIFLVCNATDLVKDERIKVYSIKFYQFLLSVRGSRKKLLF